MFKDGDLARNALLDAAEQLYASLGIDQVSNRLIAHEAGNTNHSAVRYHFGGRDGLLKALLDRHYRQIDALSATLADEVGDRGDLVDYLRCVIVPTTQCISSLRQPSHRARFLEQVRSTPSTRHLDELQSGTFTHLFERVRKEISARLTTVDPVILSARSKVLRTTISTVCAEYEATEDARDWTDLGLFLSDLAAGMLTAPVSQAHRTDERERPRE